MRGGTAALYALRMRSPPRLIPGWLAESALLLGLLFIAVGGILFSDHRPATDIPGTAALDLPAALVAIGALRLRDRSPMAVLCLVAALTLASSSDVGVTLPLLIATFTVALRCARREVAIAATLAMTALVGERLLHAGLLDPFQPVLSRLVAVALAVAAGLYFAARRAYVASLQERTAQLEREQQLLTEQAVAEERVRIARELHDVVAHAVSLMVVQAQSLRALDGAARDTAGSQIATIGREALTEMHRMLGVLRPQGDEAPELEPAPGIRDVPGLLERARGTGLDVVLRVDGDPRVLPVGVDLSAYRIVQEALTNVIKHSGARRTDVRVHYAAQALELSVVDDGVPGAVDRAPGHGLVGMRERVALFGGTLEAGRSAAGRGYAVRAVLPL